MSVPDARALRSSQRGFSLVELMVAIVMSLLVVLAAFGGARSFMGSQRQADAIGTAYANAVSATATMKYEAAQAGLGLFVDGALPCKALNLSVDETKFSDAALFLPVNVTSTALDQTTVTVAYATALESGTPAFLKEDAASTSTSVELTAYLPVSVGQAVLLAPPTAVSDTCTVKSVTEVTPEDGTHGLQLGLAATGQHNQASFGTTVNYPQRSRLFNLGALRMSRFTLLDGNLVMQRPLETDKSVVLARDVVAFVAQYGVTDGVTDSLQSYEHPVDTWETLDAVKLQKIKALRLGIVVRANQREKPDAAGNCTATESQPTVFDKTLALTGDWQCFRYRTVTVVIPLRNMMLGVDAT
jgi:type IV pilus assembly protein PilW